MLLPKHSLFASVVSWGSYIPQGYPARPMNGRFAFLSPSLLGPSLSILLSRCIYLGLELSTSTMGSLIRLLIVFIFSGWYVVSSAVKVLLRLADFLLPMI